MMTIRKKYITDVVELYKKKHKEEYKVFVKATRKKRDKLNDKNTARFAMVDDGRHVASIPEGLFVALDVFDYPRFLEEKEEQKWFLKKYPEFLVPYTY